MAGTNPTRYNLNLLDNPPPNWLLFGRADGDVTAKPKTVATWQAYLDHHAQDYVYARPWLPKAPKKREILGVLKKLFYYRDTAVHGAATVEILADDQAAHGPQLLTPGAQARVGYTAPTTSTTSRTGPSNTPQTEVTKTPGTKADNPLDIPSDDSDGSNPTAQLPTSPSRQSRPSRTDPANPRSSPDPPGDPDDNDNPESTQRSQRAVREAIERTVMKLVYRGLQRHPLSFPRTTRPHLTAQSEQELLRSITGAFPVNSHVRMAYSSSRLTYEFTGNDEILPCRGRGPIWERNSCAVDCCIVAGMLVDAGLTIADRAQCVDWYESLSILERSFLEAIDVNWSVLSPANSIHLRNVFLRIVLEALNAERGTKQYKVGNFLPGAPMWAKCTEHFRQFQFAYYDIWNNCPCRGPAQGVVDPPIHTTASVPLDPIRDGKTMEEALREYFGPNQNPCRNCKMETPGSRTRNRLIDGELPMRLVVRPDNKGWPEGSTSNHINFQYRKIVNKTNHESGPPEIATYRWLGGIYYFQTHFTVYWTDCERGEADNGNIRFYDGKERAGVILGGLPRTDMDARFMPVVLFYERIMNPSETILGAATAAIAEMERARVGGRLVLEDHTPWESLDPADVQTTGLMERVYLGTGETPKGDGPKGDGPKGDGPKGDDPKSYGLNWADSKPGRPGDQPVNDAPAFNKRQDNDTSTKPPIKHEGDVGSQGPSKGQSIGERMQSLENTPKKVPSLEDRFRDHSNTNKPISPAKPSQTGPQIPGLGAIPQKPVTAEDLPDKPGADPSAPIVLEDSDEEKYPPQPDLPTDESGPIENLDLSNLQDTEDDPNVPSQLPQDDGNTSTQVHYPTILHYPDLPQDDGDDSKKRKRSEDDEGGENNNNNNNKKDDEDSLNSLFGGSNDRSGPPSPKKSRTDEDTRPSTPTSKILGTIPNKGQVDQDGFGWPGESPPAE